MTDETMNDWLASPAEGELAVDIFREQDTLVIRSTLAGVTPEHLDIAIDGDLLTIRGIRQPLKSVNEDDWFTRECYWGPFSRSVVLPLDVYPEATNASLKNGVLEIRLPIRHTGHKIMVDAIE